MGKHQLFKVTCTLMVGAASTILLVGCMGMDSVEMSGNYGGDFGATPGGVQDMGFARELVEEGQVPPPEAFNVEGMFSEHDLPLEGTQCSTTLCLRGAMGVAPDEDDQSSAWLQVGLSSTINPETYERPSLTVVATVDVSGSMSGTPLRVSQEMMLALIDQLEPSDHFGLVTYGYSSEVVLPVTAATDLDRLRSAVNALSSNGSTNMEAGLRVSFDHIASVDVPTDLKRVWLFTDVQPNVSATTASQFETMVAEAAEDHDIGVTVFGVGVGLGQQVMVGMSHLRGGNAFSLFSSEDVTDLMEESWPWMACPIAYDLRMAVYPQDGLELSESYGIPADDGAVNIGLNVSTVFLSRKKGAILLRFLGPEGVGLEGSLEVNADLAYTSIEGEEITDHIMTSVSADELDDRGMAFSQESVAKSVALAVLVRGMHAASELYATDHDAGEAAMNAVVERIEADAEAIGDDALEAEAQLARDLRDLMAADANQGDLYSGSGYGY